MRKLTMFNFVTLNGFYKDLQGGIAWHKHSAEESKFSEESLSSGNTLLFGRVTYEMMAGFWPTEMALHDSPVVAQAMNDAEKVVFSRTLTKADWHNTHIAQGDAVTEIQKLKKLPGNDMTILGSGTIVALCAEAGLIDEYQIMVDPVIIGGGATLFQGVKRAPGLRLTSTKVFKSGVVLLSYQKV